MIQYTKKVMEGGAMITSQQRAKLRSLAQNLDPIFQIGKNGLSDNQTADILAALNARELIKISVLKSANMPAKDVLQELCARLGAEPVAQIGGKIVLYKLSELEDVKHIL